MGKDPNYIAALEKAIVEKYGEAAASNPRGTWNPDKEALYQQDIREAYRKEQENKKNDPQVQIDGLLCSKKLINKTIDRQCNFCKKYSFDRFDDLFLTKFSCCQICYLDKVKDK